jgi:hypothetical protein
MKVKIGDVIHDSEIEPIIIIFDNDNQRKSVASHLTNMQPKEGKRIYLTAPDNLDRQTCEKLMDDCI